MAEPTTQRETRRPAPPPSSAGRSSDQLKRMVRGQLSKVRADELIEALVELGYTRKEARARLINAGVTDADDDTTAISKALASEAATTPITPRQEEPAPEPGTVPAPRTLEEEEPPARTPSAPEVAVNTAVERVTPVLEDVQDWLSSRRTPGGVGGLVFVILVLWFAAIPVRGKDTRLSLLFKSLTGAVAVPVTPPQGTYDVAAHAGQWAEQVGTDIARNIVRSVPNVAEQAAGAAAGAARDLPGAVGSVITGRASLPQDLAVLGPAGLAAWETEQILKDLGLLP